MTPHDLQQRAKALIDKTLEYMEHKAAQYRDCSAESTVCVVVDLASRLGYAMAIDDGSDLDRLDRISALVRDAQTEDARDTGKLNWNLMVGDAQTITERLTIAAERTETIAPSFEDIIRDLRSPLPPNRFWAVSIVADPDDLPKVAIAHQWFEMES